MKHTLTESEKSRIKTLHREHFILKENINENNSLSIENFMATPETVLEGIVDKVKVMATNSRAMDQEIDELIEKVKGIMKAKGLSLEVGISDGDVGLSKALENLYDARSMAEGLHSNLMSSISDMKYFLDSREQ